jgi:hypothetical protein
LESNSVISFYQKNSDSIREWNTFPLFSPSLDVLHSQFSAKADIIFGGFEEAGHARNSSAASGKSAACFAMRTEYCCP